MCHHSQMSLSPRLQRRQELILILVVQRTRRLVQKEDRWITKTPIAASDLPTPPFPLLLDRYRSDRASRWWSPNTTPPPTLHLSAFSPHRAGDCIEWFQRTSPAPDWQLRANHDTSPDSAIRWDHHRVKWSQCRDDRSVGWERWWWTCHSHWDPRRQPTCRQGWWRRRPWEWEHRDAWDTWRKRWWRWCRRYDPPLDHSRRIVLAGEVDDAEYVLGGTLHQCDRRRIDNTDANERSTHENTHHNCEDVRKLSFSPFNEYRS